MPKLTVTHTEVIAIKNEMDMINAQSPALRLMLRSRIQQFLTNNETTIRIIQERIVTMQRQYCVYDAEGKAVTEVIDGVINFTYHTDHDKEKHIKAYESFMARTVTIEA